MSIIKNHDDRSGEYEHQEYPKWVSKEGKEPTIVRSEAEEKAYMDDGKEPDLSDEEEATVSQERTRRRR